MRSLDLLIETMTVIQMAYPQMLSLQLLLRLLLRLVGCQAVALPEPLGLPESLARYARALPRVSARILLSL